MMSVFGWIAICFGAIFVVVGVFKLSRIGKDADERGSTPF